MLTVKQQAFVRYYLGRDMTLHGNATQSYNKAYGFTDERVAQTSGSRLTKHPEIAAKIKAYSDKAAQATQVDANFVLEQSVRLYDRAMGDATVDVDHIDKDGNVITRQLRGYDPKTAKGALDLIGKHTAVQAFTENVEHTHVHRLETALAARQRAVEAKAAQRDDIEGQCIEIVNRAPEIDEGAPGAESEKGGSSAEVRRIDDEIQQKTTPGAAGATA